MFDSNRLRSAREARGLESKQVAENIGVTAADYSKYETNKAVLSSITLSLRLLMA